MSLRSRLAAGETLYTAWSGVPDALTVEILAAQGFDAVTLDMQHGGHHEDSVLRSLAPVLRAGKPALVRIPVGRFDMASRALDFGAEAVIAPMVNSVEDAQPLRRGDEISAGRRALLGPDLSASRATARATQADWLRDSNARTMSFAMIETRAARRCARRHPRYARHRRHLPRSVGFLDRLDATARPSIRRWKT